MSAALWLLFGLVLGLAIATPAVLTLHRATAEARTLLLQMASSAQARAEELGAMLDRVRAETVPPPPSPADAPPAPLPTEVEAAIDGFVDPDVQDEMRTRARTLLLIDPTRDPALVAEELMHG